MFKNHFQGGSHVDVFVASGRDPKLKLANVEREYNGVMKGNVYNVSGSTSCAKFPFPFKFSKYSTLNLIQQFVIFQIYIPYSRDFAMELQITDISNNKRRIMLSTSVRDISCSALHIKFPISIVRREMWVNLCLDLVSLSSQILPSQSAYKSLESFTLSGTFKLRRIFTMKSRPYDTSNDDITMDYNNSEPCTNIPQNLQFNANLPACTQVITMNKLKSSLTPATSSASAASGTTSRTELTTSGYCSSSGDYDVTSKKKEQSTHIAFGTKVPFCPPPRTRHLSTSSASRKHDTSSADTTARRSKPTQSRSADPIRRGGGKRTVPPVKPPSSARSQRQDGGGSVNLMKLVPDEQPLSQVNIFTFASQPRSVPRHRSESISTTSSTAHDGDFLRGDSDDSDSDEEDRNAIDKFYIRQVTRRSTPSPLPGGSTESLLLPRRPPSAMTSLSPVATKHGVAASEMRISTRSSNATLTASVNTLVQNSISVTNQHQQDERGDSPRRYGDDWNGESPRGDDPHSATSEDEQEDDSLDDGSQQQQQSVTINRRSVREVEAASPQGNSLHQPPPPVKILESSNFQVGTWSDSLEEEILLQMKKEVDEEITTNNNNDDEQDVDINKTNFQDNLEDSFDTSWSTYKNPPPMQPQAYDSEMRRNDPNSTEMMNGTMKGMNTMTIFNDTHSSHHEPEWYGAREEWGTLMCSPPPVLPSERRRIQESNHQLDSSVTTDDHIVIGDDCMGLSDGSSSIKSCTTQETTDDEMMLDLMYDPCLNCYFDPKTGKYYQLKN